MKDLYAQGRDTFSELVPDGGQRLDQIFQVAPDLGELAVGVVYGHLHHRTALDPRLREAVALSAIVAAGCTGTPLTVHLRTGLAAGLAPGEVVEILLETAAFAGFPRVVEALGRVTEFFREAGIDAPPSATPRQTASELIHTWQQHPTTPLGKLATGDPDPEVVGIGGSQALALFHNSARPGSARTAVHFQLQPERVDITILPAGDHHTAELPGSAVPEDDSSR